MNEVESPQKIVVKNSSFTQLIVALPFLMFLFSLGLSARNGTGAV